LFEIDSHKPPTLDHISNTTSGIDSNEYLEVQLALPGPSKELWMSLTTSIELVSNMKRK